MAKLTVSASKRYDILVTSGLGGLSAFVGSLAKGNKIAVVTDENVDRLHADAVLQALPQKELHKIVIPSGEEYKNAEQYFFVINALAELEFTREDTVLTLGGGVVGDLGAFVASTYMRGIGLVAVPTTLLSMVDSSVGGKTAIDLPKGKNLCGTFYQPDGVYINLDFTATLPEREVKNGFGEIIKYAFLGGEVTLSDVKGGISEDLVVKCLKIKRDIVNEDEREGGARKLLNLGHTVGHAIEALAGFTLSHGECVAKGLAVCLKASQRLFNLGDGTVNECREIISSCGHDLTVPFSADKIVEKMRSDKKSTGSGVDFVAIKGVDCAEVVRLTFDEIYELIK